MKKITKQREPNNLAHFRNQRIFDDDGKQIKPDFDDYPHKDELRESLFREQGGICAYCMQRISTEYNKMKIEHWHCQSNYTNEQLDYSNMLGVCMGVLGKGKKNQTCDTHKENNDIKYNPASTIINIEDLIQYKNSGEISSSDKDFCIEINTVLNLNHHILVEGRKAYLSGFLKYIDKSHPSSSLTKSDIERLITKHYDNNGGELEVYCMIVVWYLRKRLRRFK